MPQIYCCPRGHRWEGEVKSSAANPRTRVICPTCGLLALTPVRLTEAPAANPQPASGKLEDTLMEPLSKMLERASSATTEKTLPDLSVESLHAATETAGSQPPGSATSGSGPSARQAKPEVPSAPSATMPDAGKESPGR